MTKSNATRISIRQQQDFTLRDAPVTTEAISTISNKLPQMATETTKQLTSAADLRLQSNDNKPDLCQSYVNKPNKQDSSNNNNNNNNNSNNKQTDESENHDVGRQHVTRYRVVLLALTIAVVNCYAQATFCIAIVEMVLPSDFVLKAESGQEVAVVVGGGNKLLPVSAPVDLVDNSCPVEYRYRDYYDEWRFAGITDSNSTNPSPASSNDKVIDISNRFDWDASRQGLLLGAFAVGTAPLQVLGGRLAEIYGAKWVLLIGCIGTAITNLTIPFLAHFSFSLLILNRVIMGIAQAGMEPGIMCLLAKWLAPSETSFFISMQLFAICIGFFLGSLGSSFLLTLGYGWPLTYYVTGFMNLLVSLIWLVYASSTPAESKLISAEELAYLQYEQKVSQRRHKEATSVRHKLNDNHLDSNWKLDISSELADALAAQNNSYSKGSAAQLDTTSSVIGGDGQAPWMNILATPAVWAFIVTKISIRWCADVLGSEMPTYMANVLHLSIKLNGIINSIASALFAISSFLTGYLLNYILERQKLALEQGDKAAIEAKQISKTNLRKMFQSVASFGSALSLFLMTRYDCNIILSMSMLMVLSCCLVMSTGGEMQMPYDMTAQYPGTLHGMACTLSVSGWLAPPLIGLILGDQPSSRYRWNIVWYLTAAINLLGGLVFVLFADASPRDFDRCRRRSSNRQPRRRCKFQPTPQQPLALNKQQPDALGGDRGQHNLPMASYCNVVCSVSSNDSFSPPRSPRFDSKANAAWPSEDKKASATWSPHFDAELIRIRQVEESFMPSLLHQSQLDGAVASQQTIMFPFNVKQQQRQQSTASRLPGCRDDDSDHRRRKSTTCGVGSDSSLGRLWAKVVPSRKRFCVKVGGGDSRQIAPAPKQPLPLADVMVHKDEVYRGEFTPVKATEAAMATAAVAAVTQQLAPATSMVAMATKTITHL